MQITSLMDIADDVLPLLAADPSHPVALRMIGEAVAELCITTDVWREEASRLTVTPGQATYDISPNSTDTKVARVISVFLDGSPLPIRPTDWLDANVNGWRSAQGTPVYCTQRHPDEVQLVPAPTSRHLRGLTMELSLQPSRAGVGIPSWIYSRYRETIVDGAVAKLMLMPDKPWSNLAMGEFRLGRFQTGMAGISTDTATSFRSAITRTTTHH
jgi:hypothetical protein